jgi:hypothetical protein
MVLDDLKELFRAKEITFEQYQAQLASTLAAAHDRSLAAESSLSPSGERGSSQGVVKNGVSPVTEMQETPVKYEAPVTESSLSPSGERGSSQGVVKNGVSKVKSTEMEGDRSEEKGKKSKSSTGTKQMSTGGGKKVLVLPLPRPRSPVHGGGKGDGVLPSPRPRNPVPEGANYSWRGEEVPDEKVSVVKQKVPVQQEAPVMRADIGEKEGMKVPGLASDLIAAGGAAGGAVFGCGAAGCIRSAVGECVMMLCLEKHGVEDPKANASDLKVSLESIVQWFLCQQKPKPKIFVEQPPSSLTPTGGSWVTESSWACCQNFGVEEDPGLKLETMIPWWASLMNFEGCAFVEEAKGPRCRG